MAKILIVYYSLKGETIAPDMSTVYLEKGHTATAAEFIQEAVGGDMFELETVRIYAENHFEMISEAKEEHDKKFRPELKAYPDISPYDTIFLGFPNWFGTVPMPVISFVEHGDWNGKTLIPFVTSGGGGISNCFVDLAASAPGAILGKGAHFVGAEVDNSRIAIQGWAKQALG